MVFSRIFQYNSVKGYKKAEGLCLHMQDYKKDAINQAISRHEAWLDLQYLFLIQAKNFYQNSDTDEDITRVIRKGELI